MPLTVATKKMHVYEVRPRSDKRGIDLISDVLSLGRSGVVCEPESNASRSMSRAS
jgi:hypothetical protein